MKRLICCAIALLGSGPLFAAEQSPACAAKRAEIEAGIAEAQIRGNTREARGLRKALKANRDHCTTASLEAERTRDIAEATQDVAEREAELEKAERSGDARKITKHRAKLDEARRELSDAERPIPQ